MDIKIQPGRLRGTARAIPSKSQAHRALICAALADTPTHIACHAESEDIAATAACLSALGALVERVAEGYTVRPIGQEDSDTIACLPCGESGSTFRFMLPIACALGRKSAFGMKGRLPERPLSPLYEELVRHGCTLSPQGSVPFHAEGRLQPGSYALAADVSSQFISGLLFALPLLDADSSLRLTGQVESFPYVEMTMDMLKAFGIKTELEAGAFSIPGRQVYHSPGTARVEGDWSNAAFWLCAGALGEGGVTCTDLDLQSRQGDRAVMDILERFGARVEKQPYAVTVSAGKPCGTEVDARDIPDLVPILAVVAAAGQGITRIYNAARLRVKESDRLLAITDVLRGLGADINERPDGLFICGGSKLSGGEISSHGDHRIAMAAAIAATVCTEPVVIHGAEAVNKSYPGFFEDLRLLGGSCQIIQE